MNDAPSPRPVEQRLRDLMARAIPEAPAVTSGPAVARGRRARRRRRASTGALVVAAAAALGAMVVGPATGPDTARDTVASYVDDRGDAVPPTDPHTAVPCPTRLPGPSPDSLPLLPDLDAVTAVRLCTDPRDLEYLREPPTPAEQAARAPADALVTGLDGFADRVADLPAADPHRCAFSDLLMTRTALVLELEDGTTALVPSGFCLDVGLDGRSLDAHQVLLAWAESLQAQRDTYHYTTDPSTPLTCRTVATSPVVARPGRDELVEAITCPPYDQGRTAVSLDGTAMARLRAAWARTAPPTSTPVDGGACQLADDGFGTVIARTSTGDVLSLAETPCDHLLLGAAAPGEHQEVPVTLDALR